MFLGSSSLRGPLRETLFSLLPENDSFDESCFKRLGATLDRKVRRNKRDSRGVSLEDSGRKRVIFDEISK